MCKVTVALLLATAAKVFCSRAGTTVGLSVLVDDGCALILPSGSFFALAFAFAFAIAAATLAFLSIGGCDFSSVIGS